MLGRRSTRPARGEPVGDRRWRTILDPLLAGFLPGALLGAQIAGLLFFLNPDLPFRLPLLARGMLVYGALVGTAGLLVQLPFLWGRPHRARRLLPWSFSGVLAVAALLDGLHAARLAYFLPPGINERLIKAALWLALGALIAFYTALLHTLHRRPYGRRSRIGLAVLAAAALYVVAERREAFRPSPPASPRPSAVAADERPRLLWVGVDGATLDAVLPLAEQGRLPFLANLLRNGAYGSLASLTPNRERALWTSLATGKYPYKHGVLGSERCEAAWLPEGLALDTLPQGIGFRHWGLGPPGETDCRRTDRPRALPLWTVLARLGLDTGAVGWPLAGAEAAGARPKAASLLGEGTEAPGATAPTGGGAAPGGGFVLPEPFFTETGPDEAAATGLAARARLFRVEPDELDPNLLVRFGDEPPGPLVRALADDLWRESLTHFLLTREEAAGDAVFLRLPGLGEVSRRFFGGYAATRFEGAKAAEYERAARLLTAYYAQVDDLLEKLWSARSGPTLLVLVSAYGTEAPEGWRRIVRQIAGGKPVEGFTDRSPDGLLVLHGPGIAAGERLTGARLVDVVPTVLYGLGFPVARDLDGRVLTAAFERSFLARHPLLFLPSYETVRTGPREPSSP